MERRVPEPSNAEESQLIGFNGISWGFSGI
jgi:hypothetical protein